MREALLCLALQFAWVWLLTSWPYVAWPDLGVTCLWCCPGGTWSPCRRGQWVVSREEERMEVRAASHVHFGHLAGSINEGMTWPAAQLPTGDPVRSWLLAGPVWGAVCPRESPITPSSGCAHEPQFPGVGGMVPTLCGCCEGSGMECTAGVGQRCCCGPARCLGTRGDRNTACTIPAKAPSPGSQPWSCNRAQGPSSQETLELISDH